MKDYSNYISIFDRIQFIAALVVAISLCLKFYFNDKQKVYISYNTVAENRILELLSNINANNDKSVLSFLELIEIEEKSETNYIRNFSSLRIKEINSYHSDKYSVQQEESEVNYNWLKKNEASDLKNGMQLFLRKKHLSDFAQSMFGVNHSFQKNFSLRDINKFLLWIESEDWIEDFESLKSKHLIEQ